MLLMSASAPVAARPREPPSTQWSGTQLSTPTHGGRQGKARPLGTILPFTGTHSHRGCSMASPRHMHSTCLPSYSFCKRQDLWLCPNPGSAAQAAPQHANPAWGHSSHSLPPAADANRPGAHKHPLCPASISTSPARHRAGTSSTCRCQPEARLLQLPPTSTAVPCSTEKPPRHQLQADLQPQSGTYCHLPGAATAVLQPVRCSSSSAALTHDG